MRLNWTRLFRCRAYQDACAEERLLMEIRFSLAKTLRDRRWHMAMRQAALAQRIGAAPATISRLELGQDDVSMDMYVRAMIALRANTAQIAAGFDADARQDIRSLRVRAGAQTRIPGWKKLARARLDGA